MKTPKKQEKKNGNAIKAVQRVLEDFMLKNGKGDYHVTTSGDIFVVIHTNQIIQ